MIVLVIPSIAHAAAASSRTIGPVNSTARRRSARLRDAFPLGVAAVQELIAHGVPERTVYQRCLEGGPWRRVLPGIILLFTGCPTVDQLVHAALLLGGPDAVLPGVEACRRHGVRRGPVRRDDSERQPEIHILVPHARQIRSVGFVHVERTQRIPVPILREGIPLAPLVRACTDAARRIRSTGEVTELFADPVQRGRCTVAGLWAELESGSRRGTAVPRAVLADLAAGVRSAAERAAKQLWPQTGLPEPWWNASVSDADGRFLGVADCWVDDVAMVWEIESSEWHLSPAAHEYTVRRAAQFTAAGAVYVASKPKMVLNDSAGVKATLRAVYAQAAARPRPSLTAKPATN
ncbi:MAG: hypothetical protein K0R87_2337 [Pseudonocardia sp.]|jgi:hypothetical protein|nr:hypothetical protein [Pseudonocardia sp.]